MGQRGASKRGHRAAEAGDRCSGASHQLWTLQEMVLGSGCSQRSRSRRPIRDGIAGYLAPACEGSSALGIVLVYGTRAPQAATLEPVQVYV